VARIAGVNIPTAKRVVIALTYIHGIGDTKAHEICEKVGIPMERRVNELTDAEVIQIRETIDSDYLVEGDLRRENAMNIKRLLDMGIYRGLRHRRNLPVRGQRTHTNARTRKGPAKAIAGKKKYVGEDRLDNGYRKIQSSPPRTQKHHLRHRACEFDIQQYVDHHFRRARQRNFVVFGRFNGL